MTYRMPDDKLADPTIKLMVFLTTEIDDAQLELLYSYTQQYTLAEFVASIELAKQTRSLLQTV